MEVPGAYIIAILVLTLLFYLEGLMIAIVGTQYWDPGKSRYLNVCKSAHLIFLLFLIFYILGWRQLLDAESFRDVYPRAYRIHKLINQPDNVKRFIIGRQFCTVLTGFLLAQIFTFANFENEGYDPVAFFIIIKSGLVGVLIVLAFGQLMPELLAAEFPLRFMNMPGTVAMYESLESLALYSSFRLNTSFHFLYRVLYCMLYLFGL